MAYFGYCKTSNISCTIVSNKFVDYSDVVGASPVGAAPNYIFILDLIPVFYVKYTHKEEKCMQGENILTGIIQ